MALFPVLDVPRREDALHFFVRESQTVLKWTVRILAAITVLTMITFWFWAAIPATLTIVAYFVLLGVDYVERRSDHRPAAPTGDAASAATVAIAAGRSTGALATDPVEPHPALEIVPMPLLRHETLIVGAGALAVLVLAVILATLFFGGTMMLLAVPFLFAYIVLLSSPVWLAAIEDDLEAETGKQA